MQALTYLVYGLPGAALLFWQFRRRRRLERQSRAVLEHTGAAEPASLHPVIDPARCIGCGSCVKACPEQEHHDVLGIVDGRAELVSPGDCIGHGACRQAARSRRSRWCSAASAAASTFRCLVQVLNPPCRGFSSPANSAAWDSSATPSNRAARRSRSIAQRRVAGAQALDLMIVGAGPAGFAASLTALSKGMRFVTLEQESLGGSVFQYPRGKLVMTAPATVPLVGKVNFRQTSKETLLKFWQETERKTEVKINYQERVEEIVRDGSAFKVRSNRGQLRGAARAAGDRPARHAAQARGAGRGPRQSRLSADRSGAIRRTEGAGGGRRRQRARSGRQHRRSGQRGRGAVVPRCETFDRAKAGNRERVQAAAGAGRMQVLMKSQVKRIEPEAVALEHGEQILTLPNDAVIVSAGGVLPSDFLRRIGIASKPSMARVESAGRCPRCCAGGAALAAGSTATGSMASRRTFA